MKLLNGWKEIADHLRLTVRTAQRWEQLGLPVRRISQSLCSPVVAIPDEIELWTRTRNLKTGAALLVSNKFLVTRLAESRETHSKTRHETRTLLGELGALGLEQQRLLSLIQANLAWRLPSLEKKSRSSRAAPWHGFPVAPRNADRDVFVRL